MDDRPGPAAAFSADDLATRADRLIGFEADVLALPGDHGDHRLNPGWLPTGRSRDAAVLIAAIDRGGTASVLLTRRTDHLAAHAGQVAFPGGKIDPEDASPLAAALREAQEEIGLDPLLVRPLGYGDPYITTSGYRIVPVVALVRGEPVLAPNPHEVADVFEVPLAFLMTPANHLTDSREWQGRRRHFYVMPYEQRRIWGVTAGIVRALFERIYG